MGAEKFKEKVKEDVIYDTIEVLPAPRREPVSESNEDGDEESSESSDSDNNDIYNDNSTMARELTVDPEPIMFRPSSLKEPPQFQMSPDSDKLELRSQRI
jgi:hypothetical protein